MVSIVKPTQFYAALLGVWACVDDPLLMIAIVGYRIAYAAQTPWKAPALALWALQIALNTLWTPVFFGAKSLGVQ